MHWKHQFEFAGYYIAKEKGFYKELGLDVTLNEVKFRSKPIIENVEKDLYAFGSSSSTLLIDKTNGKNVVALASTFQSSPLVLLSLKSSGIKSIKDFKNKTIMMNSKLTQTASFISMISSQGLSLMDMKRVDYTYRIDELLNKEVDIAPYLASNQTFTLEQKGIEYDIWDPKDYGFDFYHGLIYTGAKTLEYDPIAVRDFKKATLRGYEYAFNNIDETVELILKKYNTQNKTKEHLLYEAKILKKYAYVDNIPLGEIDKNKIQRIYDVYNFLGLMESKLDLDDFVYEDDKKFTLSKKEKEYLKEKKVINLCIDPNWMPFEKLTKNNEHIGITGDYFRIFKKEFKLPIRTIKTDDWSQSLEYIKSGKCDALSLITSSLKRENYLSFTKPYVKASIVLATKQDVPFITDLNSLTKKEKIGVTKGYIYKDLLIKRHPNLNIVEVKDNVDGLQKVIDDKLFAYVDALPSIGYLFQTKFIGELKIASKFDELDEQSIAVRKDEKVLLGIFNKAIYSLSNEVHRNILNKWVAINYNENKVDYTLFFNLLLVIAVLSLLLIYRQYLLKKSNENLQKNVKEKTKELKDLNKNLERKVEEAIKENREKDIILYRQSKMASMGEMIGNIAHQWRQPLNNINSNIMSLDVILSNENIKNEKIEKEFISIENQTEYLSKTIDDFQNFLKPSSATKKFNIKKVFEKNLNMFGNTFSKNNIQIISKLKDVNIIGSENELLQVTINILNNAKEALKTNNTKNRYIFIECFEEDNNAIIKIKDNAGGVSEDIKEKIFDAYFTTKDSSTGTGLGLYMCYQIIINKFDGELNMQNEEYSYDNNQHKGALFIIKIPIKKEEK